MWRDYDRSVIERDLGYASRLNLNAIRTWINYEYWHEDREACRKQLNHLLSTADDNGIRVLLALFEGVGSAPTEENLTNTDPMTATTVASPSAPVMKNSDRWDEPREFVRWLFDGWADDDRLLGFEVMNEPGWQPYSKRFARGMFRTMRKHRGSVPLTVGSTSVANDLDYRSWGSEIFQFHYNFPIDEATFRDALRQVAIIRERVDQPIWLTEWQRIRSGRGFHAEPEPDERVPNYSSMASIIKEFEFGNFFWSLMVKPAVVPSQRRHGVINGIFHEDGAVWSLDDARAIKAMSGDPGFDGRERSQWPEWASEIKEQTSENSG
ncbi:glycoside hydrolase [Haloarculaceae archaeon H-GB11]|nr:glycoside hydrolase [Haloarculaceae archaeon H-GB11]